MVLERGILSPLIIAVSLTPAAGPMRSFMRMIASGMLTPGCDVTLCLVQYAHPVSSSMTSSMMVTSGWQHGRSEVLVHGAHEPGLQSLTPGSRVGARSDDLHLILQHQPGLRVIL
jgi:hypothetical protein